MLRPYEQALKSEVKRHGTEKADNESGLKGYADNGENRSKAEVEDRHGTAGYDEPRGAAVYRVVGDVWLVTALLGRTNGSRELIQASTPSTMCVTGRAPGDVVGR